MSGFAGLRVLSLESRRAPELAKLITTYGGEAIVAPSMREVPLESNTEALAFAAALFEGKFDMVIFLTGVGAGALFRLSPVNNGHCRTTWRRSAPPSRQLLKELWMLLSLRRQFRRSISSRLPRS